ncbi:putative metalloprotease CJM1_0395 family protein [Aquisalimonas lutea]|uniref:putative metalloprotease CJM1_0395 family protein n=1 Tax=Aquisalimonas lutea TaxID=1327750 RepID=UPI0025B4DAD6|nr:putative metalloprotease CJM1_0395 family protein [Aquisalimonas lutea]MDN3516131.1 putative metalloprotease CJM1_0395 family protein [Aquisalimonas lutea]
METGPVRNDGSSWPSAKAANPRRARAADADNGSVVRELRARDREVRAHEQAHASVGGPHAGTPAYTLTFGPDGRAYAVGGRVQIDTSPVEGDPAATVDKMEQVARAALAPAEPSAADLAVAREARANATRARSDMAGGDDGNAATRAFSDVAAMGDEELLRRGGRLDLFV